MDYREFLVKEALGLRRAQRLAKLVTGGKLPLRQRVFNMKHGFGTMHPYEIALNDVKRRLVRGQLGQAMGQPLEPVMADALKYVNRGGRAPLQNLERQADVGKSELLRGALQPEIAKRISRRKPEDIGALDPFYVPKIKNVRYPQLRAISQQTIQPVPELVEIPAKFKKPGKKKWKKGVMSVEKGLSSFPDISIAMSKPGIGGWFREMYPRGLALKQRLG